MICKTCDSWKDGFCEWIKTKTQLDFDCAAHALLEKPLILEDEAGFLVKITKSKHGGYNLFKNFKDVDGWEWDDNIGWHSAMQYIHDAESLYSLV